MPKVKFKFDKDRDIWNYWSSVNETNQFLDFSKFIPSDLLILIKKKTQKETYDSIKNHLSQIHNSPLIKIYIESISRAWETIEEEYFKKLTKLTKKPVCSERFTAYITTTKRCPYNKEEKWFMINFFGSIQHALVTIAHEIMHFQFYKYYSESIEKQIGKEKTEDLKEALTVLLNLEFLDLWYIEDNGYSIHKELRKFIEDKWREEKDFDVLLEKCINYLKCK